MRIEESRKRKKRKKKKRDRKVKGKKKKKEEDKASKVCIRNRGSPAQAWIWSPVTVFSNFSNAIH